MTKFLVTLQMSGHPTPRLNVVENETVERDQFVSSMWDMVWDLIGLDL